ncbi:MAG: hypothetical protein VB034_09490 [Eubacteriales bacterium]|nr:hypothetical protein [Petrimonas sp.]MEA5048826.1 hypothetical protein [Eubacteriales bacterium]
MIKRIGQVSVLLVTYISISIVLLILLVGSFILIDHFRYKAQYSIQKIERAYHRNEESFQAAVSYLQGIDTTDFQKEGIERPVITIQKSDELPNDTIYKYSVFSTSATSVTISNREMNSTLDDLFRNTDLTSIWQTNAAESPSIFFNFSVLAGLVFSPSGHAPIDSFDASMVYSYERINDNWFYWAGTWPD